MTEQQFVDRWSEPSLRRAIELGQYKQVGGPGLAAAVLIGLATAVGVVSTWTSWNGYLVARDYVAGEPGVTEDDLDSADSLISAFAWGYVLVLLAAGATFLVWLWRARTNAQILCEAKHRRARGWVIGSWFCPIVNLWFPFMIVDDIYRASRPDNPRDLVDLRSVPGWRLLGWWWAAWLVTHFVDRILIRMYRDNEITVNSLRTEAILETVGTAVYVAAAVAIIMIMRRISFWQSPG